MHMDNEGCGCCEDHKGHKESAIALAELLGMDLHDDKSGVNYAKYLDRHAKEV